MPTVEIPTVNVGNRQGITLQNLVEHDLMSWVDKFRLELDIVTNVYLLPVEIPGD